MKNAKIYINGKKVGTTGIIEMDTSLFIHPPVTPIVIIPEIKEAAMTCHAHIDPICYYAILGIPMTNNYLKMNGGILQRKARRRKKRKKMKR